MAKLPQDDKQIIVTNGIDALQGFIAYTKNIDLDEKGVFKLSAPMCKIGSSEDDADLTLPIDIFAYNDGNYKVITADEAFNFVMSNLSLSEDSGGVGWFDKSRVINWNNGNWFVGGDDVYEYDGASGSSTYTSRISTQLDFIELFTSRNTLVGAVSDNTLRQYDDAYSLVNTLEIPENFEITGAKYSNNLMGLITKGSKNLGNAYFFTWDGETAAPNAGYPVYDSYLTGLDSYKSSWVLFSTAGQLLYFNGGGFEELGNLPTFRFEDDLISLGPNNSIDVGNIIHVDGDVVYVNCASLPEFSSNNRPYRPGFSAGVYCYDPEVGFYHKYAPSYSTYKKEDATASSNVLTFSTPHYLETGDEVWLEATDLGLTGSRMYFAIMLSSTTIKLADTYEDAQNTVSVSMSDGTLNDLWFVKRRDFGIESLRLKDCGLVKKLRSYDGANESRAIPMFIGADVFPNTVSSQRVSVFNIAVPTMSNRGYLITSKFQTDNFEDNWQGVAVKYSKLSQQSSIVVKAKVVDQDSILVGDMTLYEDTYSGPSISWDANGTTFETTADLSDVEVDDEVHVFVGAGAGQSAHVSSIELDGSVYRVVLDEKLRGITSNATSCISIDKWVKIGTITADDTDGVKFFPLAQSSPNIEIKLELRGVGVRIREIIPIREIQKPNRA